MNWNIFLKTAAWFMCLFISRILHLFNGGQRYSGRNRALPGGNLRPSAGWLQTFPRTVGEGACTSWPWLQGHWAALARQLSWRACVRGSMRVFMQECLRVRVCACVHVCMRVWGGCMCVCVYELGPQMYMRVSKKSPKKCYWYSLPSWKFAIFSPLPGLWLIPGDRSEKLPSMAFNN